LAFAKYCTAGALGGADEKFTLYIQRQCLIGRFINKARLDNGHYYPTFTFSLRNYRCPAALPFSFSHFHLTILQRVRGTREHGTIIIIVVVVVIVVIVVVREGRNNVLGKWEFIKLIGCLAQIEDS
jgi:hypothetical protein